MTAQVAADLRAAAEAIKRHGWSQGVYRDEDGCYCQAGALIVAVAPGARMTTWGLAKDESERWEAAEAALEGHLFGDGRLQGRAIAWNDEPGRTADEVIAALEAAADAAERAA